jgi:hypothetical protein
MTVKYKSKAPSKSVQRSAWKKATNNRHETFKGWTIYKDSRGYFVSGKTMLLKGKKLRKVVSRTTMAAVKQGITALYNKGFKDIA